MSRPDGASGAVQPAAGLHRIDLATAAAKEHLAGWQEGETARKRGGGSLEALAAVYLDTPKRTAAGPQGRHGTT